MEGKKLLIAGIDPGTTVGYAFLDIEGNLLCLNSSKQIDLNFLVSEAVKFGKVVLVGTDKSKAPGLVESFAAKLGARVIIPQHDLKVDEKRKMTKDFRFQDSHQGDALASALLAYKETKALLDKIDFFAEENSRQSIRNEIKELVIAKRLSIKAAAALIEKKAEEDKITEKIVAEKNITEDDVLRLYNRLKRYESELELARKYNGILSNRIKNFEKNEAEKAEAKPRNKKNDYGKPKDFREARIRFLESRLKFMEKGMEGLKSLIKNYSRVMSSISEFLILKKLGTFGINEFNFRNKILNIQRNDMLLVDDPNIASSSVIDLLKNRVFVVVCKKPASRKNEAGMPFVFISAQKLKIWEDRYFGFADRKQFELEKSKAGWARKIIEEYQREKEQLIG